MKNSFKQITPPIIWNFLHKLKYRNAPPHLIDLNYGNQANEIKRLFPAVEFTCIFDVGANIG